MSSPIQEFKTICRKLVHVFANLRTVATVSHFSSRHLFCQHFVDLGALLGDRTTREAKENLLSVCYEFAWFGLCHDFFSDLPGNSTILVARAGRL